MIGTALNIFCEIRRAGSSGRKGKSRSASILGPKPMGNKPTPWKNKRMIFICSSCNRPMGLQNPWHILISFQRFLWRLSLANSWPILGRKMWDTWAVRQFGSCILRRRIAKTKGIWSIQTELSLDETVLTCQVIFILPVFLFWSNDKMFQLTFRMRWKNLEFHTSTTSTLPKNCHRARITTKMFDVILNPSSF